MERSVLRRPRTDRFEPAAAAQLRFEAIGDLALSEPPESLEAALHPAEAEYLYFVSRNDGSHQFSRTLAEHRLAVKKFQN